MKTVSCSSGPSNLLRSFQALGFFVLLLSAIGLPGVYARETTDKMNQLLLCSRYGKKELYLMAAVLFASITMLLSLITQNSMTVTCSLLGYLMIDLFASVPDRFRVLQAVWSLRPNAVLMNTGFVNYRLIRFAGKYFLNYQAAPVVYAVIAAAVFMIGQWKYRRLQVGK